MEKIKNLWKKIDNRWRKLPCIIPAIIIGVSAFILCHYYSITGFVIVILLWIVAFASMLFLPEK
jgi:hypothetical protein